MRRIWKKSQIPCGVKQRVVRVVVQRGMRNYTDDELLSTIAYSQHVGSCTASTFSCQSVDVPQLEGSMQNMVQIAYTAVHAAHWAQHTSSSYMYKFRWQQVVAVLTSRS